MESDMPVFDGVNGYDENGDLWVNGVKAKISKRQPKVKKTGSLSWKNQIPKTGSIRAGGMVGGVVDAQSGEHKGSVKSPTESAAERRIDNKNNDD